PSGLGWLPDGRLLIVAMMDKSLLRLDQDGLVVAADLSNLASSYCNDMVVDKEGRAYIGNFGYDLFAHHPYAQGEIILVAPNGAAQVVADKMDFPNGMVITPDGLSLIVAETAGHRLTAFDIESDGSLTHRRLWAHIEGSYPDGICLDQEGAIWVAAQGFGEVLRVKQGGEVTHRIQVTTKPFACMLGDSDHRTLFVTTSETYQPAEARASKSGRIEILQVEVPGSGLP
ncbi:MAG: SMP-30/gluconolactonase/LRE family protein, partial [Anaerolineae bacterium]|nr:SMP-30/gluconolactonase/LRE family protein [Anaerolineae bacterium]